jgi:putative polyhydroxyalkanoate system protein
MATISIAKKHHYSHRKAKEVAEKIAKDLQKRFDLGYVWKGDHVDFERPGVSGRMHVGEDRIALDVRLGFLLLPLKGAIEREIHAQLDQLIRTEKPAAAPRAHPRGPRKSS